MTHKIPTLDAASKTTDARDIAPDDAQIDQGPPSDRRRCKRVSLVFPIEVSGFDDAGRLFHEVTVTRDISEVGCKFHLLRTLKKGEVIAIQLGSRNGGQAEKSKPLLFEVVWIEPSEHGWMLGAAKLQPDNFWHVTFPPKKPDENSST